MAAENGVVQWTPLLALSRCGAIIWLPRLWWWLESVLWHKAGLKHALTAASITLCLVENKCTLDLVALWHSYSMTTNCPVAWHAGGPGVEKRCVVPCVAYFAGLL